MVDRSLSAQALLQLIEKDFSWLFRQGRRMTLRVGDQCGDGQSRSENLYLIDTALISLGVGLIDGRSAEVALLGNGAVLGFSGAYGCGFFPYRATAQRTGDVWRFNVSGTQSRLLESPNFRRHVHTSMQNVMAQITQSALCNRHHHIDQQLAKTLLQYHDLTASREVFLTQQELSDLLGVRREGVTQAVGKLQLTGSIDNRRGCIRVLDYCLLASYACECYHVFTRNRLSVDSESWVRAGKTPASNTQRRLRATNMSAPRPNTIEIRDALSNAAP